MNTEVAIILTVGGITGSILVTQLLQLNWFRRERFKMHKKKVDMENRIAVDALRKQLMLKPTKKQATYETDNIIGKVAKHIGNAISNSEEGAGGIINDFLEENPEIIQSFFQGLISKSKNNEEQDTEFWNN